MALAPRARRRARGLTPRSIWNSYSSRSSAALGDEPLALLDQPLVVRRDPDVGAAVEQRARAPRTKFSRTSSNPGTRSPPARRRCPCRAGRSASGRRAPRCRRASAAGTPGARCRRCRARPRAARGRAQRVVRRSSSPPCRSARSCRARAASPHEPLEDLAAEAVVELEAEAGELDADVGVEALRVDRPEDVVVLVGDASASSRVVISSPRTSIVASFPSRVQRSTTRHASSTRVPAM